MNFTHYYLETGDSELWLVATVDALIGENYSNALRPIVASSEQCSAYEARMYNRGGSYSDPEIGVRDISPATVVYGQGSYGTNSWNNNFINHNGGNVWVGKLK